jgi:hypothetical protein
MDANENFLEKSTHAVWPLQILIKKWFRNVLETSLIFPVKHHAQQLPRDRNCVSPSPCLSLKLLPCGVRGQRRGPITNKENIQTLLWRCLWGSTPGLGSSREAAASGEHLDSLCALRNASEFERHFVQLEVWGKYPSCL